MKISDFESIVAEDSQSLSDQLDAFNAAGVVDLPFKTMERTVDVNGRERIITVTVSIRNEALTSADPALRQRQRKALRSVGMIK